MTEYTAEYFIKKFSDPKLKWITNTLHSRNGKAHCALGHCGGSETPEGRALLGVFYHSPFTLANVNDGRTYRYKQRRIRARVIAALKALIK